MEPERSRTTATLTGQRSVRLGLGGARKETFTYRTLSAPARIRLRSEIAWIFTNPPALEWYPDLRLCTHFRGGV
jgi:hypothetical protein